MKNTNSNKTDRKINLKKRINEAVNKCNNSISAINSVTDNLLEYTKTSC